MRTPHPPADHRPSDLSEHTFDVIVLGAGSTGENVVSRAVAGGLSVAVVEPELVGGECSYWACMPSKALLRGSQALGAVRQVDGAKQAVTGGQDVARTLQRRDKFNSGFDDSGQVEWVESTGATLIRGAGRLAGDKQVSVTGADGNSVTVTARRAVAVCTGSYAAIPPIDGMDQVGPWDNREITSAEEVPASLAVIGGGPVGAEMADAWHALGSTVTLIEGADRLLPTMEPEAGRRLGAALTERGVDVRTGVTVTAVRRDGSGGPVTVTLDGGDEVTAAQLLVAVGRRPATTEIGLSVVGLEDGAPLAVDGTQTVEGVAGDWLYAAGDCTTGAKLTHMGKYAARICGDVIVARARGGLAPADTAGFGRLSSTALDGKVPSVVFTTPEVAGVGLTEAAARDAGIAVRAVEYEIGNVAGASLYADGYDGWAKLVVDTAREVIVGATFVGPDVAELLHAATVAVVGEVPLSRLWHAVPSYPTVSEIWLRLLETWGL